MNRFFAWRNIGFIGIVGVFGITGITLGWSQAAFAEQPKLAVMPLVASRLPAATVQIMDGFLAAGLDAAGKYQVIGVSEINSMLGLEKMKDVAGCSDDVCAAEIGGALGVDFLVTGNVGILGEELVVQLVLLNVRSAKVTGRGRGIVVNEEKYYRHAIDQAVASLLGIMLKPPAQTVSVKPASGGYRFETDLEEPPFDVIVMASDGTNHECKEALTAKTACLLTGLPKGSARLKVRGKDLLGFSDTFTVRDTKELFSIQVSTIPSEGSIISWTFGGMGLLTGIPLLSLGIARGGEGFIYGGVSSMLIGAGLVVLGSLLNSRVAVDYPGIDWLF